MTMAPALLGSVFVGGRGVGVAAPAARSGRDQPGVSEELEVHRVAQAGVSA